MARRSPPAGDSKPAKTTTRTRKPNSAAEAKPTPADAQSPAAQAVAPQPRRSKTSVVTEAADGVAAPTSRPEPTPEEIRRRAYELYLARRGVGGSPEQDWLQAERELRAR